MDAIDRVVSQWAKEKPELDTEPMAIMGRLMRIAKHMENHVAELHKRYDLKMGEFDVLSNAATQWSAISFNAIGADFIHDADVRCHDESA